MSRYFALGITASSNPSSTASYCLTLPGKQLVLSTLLQAKKFRARGNKDGAVAAFRELDKAGLGTLEEKGMQRGTGAVSACICLQTCTCNNYIVLLDLHFCKNGGD